MMRQCSGCASIRTLDAIHLATCRFTHAYPLVTNDRIMRKAAERIGIPLGPLPTDENRDGPGCRSGNDMLL